MNKPALLFIILFIISCSIKGKNSIDIDNPKRVIAAGKVLNFSNEWHKISLNVNRIGFTTRDSRLI